VGFFVDCKIQECVSENFTRNKKQNMR
jgi:hypothetical protein